MINGDKTKKLFKWKIIIIFKIHIDNNDIIYI